MSHSLIHTLMSQPSAVIQFQYLDMQTGGTGDRTRDEEDGLYLDDEGLVLEAGTHPQLAHVGRLVDEVLDAVENSSAGGGDPPVDSSLTDGLPGDAGVSVDVLKGKKERGQ